MPRSVFRIYSYGTLAFLSAYAQRIRVIIGRLQLSIKEGSSRKRVGEQEIADRISLFCNIFTKILIQHLVAELTSKEFQIANRYPRSEHDLNETIRPLADHRVKPIIELVCRFLDG